MPDSKDSVPVAVTDKRADSVRVTLLNEKGDWASSTTDLVTETTTGSSVARSVSD